MTSTYTYIQHFQSGNSDGKNSVSRHTVVKTVITITDNTATVEVDRETETTIGSGTNALSTGDGTKFTRHVTRAEAEETLRELDRQIDEEEERKRAAEEKDAIGRSKRCCVVM
jgi:hypothetical protein